MSIPNKSLYSRNYGKDNDYIIIINMYKTKKYNTLFIILFKQTISSAQLQPKCNLAMFLSSRGELLLVCIRND